MPTTKLCKKSQHTLERIFKRPHSRKLKWPDVVALVQHLGAVKMEPEGEFVFSANGASWKFCPTDDENVLNDQQVSDLRDFMKAAGVDKSGTTEVEKTWAHAATPRKKPAHSSPRTPITSREVRLVSRPRGVPTSANFSLAETALEPLQAVFMTDTALYSTILGIRSPWEVMDVTLDIEAITVAVRLDYVAREGTVSFSYPTCGLPCPVYDRRPARMWRHLDSCQFETYLVASLPRVACAEHGVHTASVF